MHSGHEYLIVQVKGAPWPATYFCLDVLNSIFNVVLETILGRDHAQDLASEVK